MVAELNILTEWIPEQMQPGTVFVLENAGELGKNEDPYWAVLACPECGTLGLITRRQMAGITPVICGSEKCSAHFFIRDEDVQARALRARERLGGRADVLLARACQGCHGRSPENGHDGADALEVAGRGDREAGFDDVDVEPF